MKKTQTIAIWLLPVILIGGMIWPLLGYLVAGMMVFFIILSYFRGRYWCWNLCPRGAFLDIVLARVSAKKKIPKPLTSKNFRWPVLALVICIFLMQLILMPKTFPAIGSLFVRMCLATTLISILVGIPIHHRTWCAFCPMGTLQEEVGKLRK
jgi:ferredoxin-type protein NapH